MCLYTADTKKYTPRKINTFLKNLKVNKFVLKKIVENNIK